MTLRKTEPSPCRVAHSFIYLSYVFEIDILWPSGSWQLAGGTYTPGFIFQSTGCNPLRLQNVVHKSD